MKKPTGNLTHRELEKIRVSAIRAWKSGAAINMISRSVGVHRGTVSRWVSTYRRSGAIALRGKPTPGRPKSIDCDFYGKKILKIIKGSATRYGYDNPLWNCKRICEVFYSELSLKVSVPTIWRSLRDLGLSSQKPERRAFEQDPKRVNEWLKKEWPKIRKKAKKERAIIFFQDESTVCMHSNMGSTWAPIGETPIIKMTGKRASVPVISAISISGKLLFSVLKSNVNSEVFITFLKNVLKEVPRKRIHLITDNAPSHTSNKVVKFLEKQERIKIHYLPAYAPELNPDEYTWSHLKRNKLQGHQSKTKADLRSKIIGSMRSIQKNKKLIKSFFKRSMSSGF